MKSAKPLKTMALSMKTLHIPLFTACLLLLFTASLFLAAQARGETPKPVKCPYLEGRGVCAKELAAKLNLTKEQSGQIQSIRTEYQKETADLKEAIRTKKASLDERFRDPKASEKQILAAQEEVAALKAKKRQKTMQARLKARSILTPEQIRNIPPGCGLGIGGKGACGGKGCGKCSCGKNPHGKAPCGKHKGQGHQPL
jgi:Spy/CpxP family protein refolding chaperone